MGDISKPLTWWLLGLKHGVDDVYYAVGRANVGGDNLGAVDLHGPLVWRAAKVRRRHRLLYRIKN